MWKSELNTLWKRVSVILQRKIGNDDRVKLRTKIVNLLTYLHVSLPRKNTYFIFSVTNTCLKRWLKDVFSWKLPQVWLFTTKGASTGIGIKTGALKMLIDKGNTSTKRFFRISGL